MSRFWKVIRIAHWAKPYFIVQKFNLDEKLKTNSRFFDKCKQTANALLDVNN